MWGPHRDRYRLRRSGESRPFLGGSTRVLARRSRHRRDVPRPTTTARVPARLPATSAGTEIDQEPSASGPVHPGARHADRTPYIHRSEQDRRADDGVGRCLVAGDGRSGRQRVLRLSGGIGLRDAGRNSPERRRSARPLWGSGTPVTAVLLFSLLRLLSCCRLRRSW